MTKFNEIPYHTRSDSEFEVDAPDLGDYIGHYIVSARFPPIGGVNYSEIVEVSQKGEFTVLRVNQYDYTQEEWLSGSFSFFGGTKAVICPDLPESLKNKVTPRHNQP